MDQTPCCCDTPKLNGKAEWKDYKHVAHADAHDRLRVWGVLGTILVCILVVTFSQHSSLPTRFFLFSEPRPNPRGGLLLLHLPVLRWCAAVRGPQESREPGHWGIREEGPGPRQGQSLLIAHRPAHCATCRHAQGANAFRAHVPLQHTRPT